MHIPCRLNHPCKILLIGAPDFQTVPQHIFTLSAAEQFQPEISPPFAILQAEKACAKLLIRSQFKPLVSQLFTDRLNRYIPFFFFFFMF